MARSKSVVDARSLTVSFALNSSVSSCGFCRQTGALLTCARCQRAFHLVCLGITTDDLPACGWFCVACVGVVSRKAEKEQRKLVKEQRERKDALVREALQLLQSDNDESLREFARLNPDCVKQGKIQYPVEDTLIRDDPQLHQVDPYLAIPSPAQSAVQPQVLGDLLYICDFFYTFRSVLRVTPFTPEQLYIAANARVGSATMREILLSLVFLVTKGLIAQGEAPGQDTSYVRLLRLLQTCVQLEEVLPLVYLVLLQELVEWPGFREYIEEQSLMETILTSKMAEFPLEDCFFRDYSLREKCELMFFLINCALDCKETHEELAKRIEARDRFLREKHEIESELKSLEQHRSDKSSHQSEEPRVSELASESEEMSVRTKPLGFDRDHNEYYQFPFEDGRVYVRMPLPIDAKKPKVPADSGYWYLHTAETLGKLLGALCAKGCREAKLIQALRKVKPQKSDKEDNSIYTAKSSLALVLCEYVNVESQFEPVEDLLQTARGFLLRVESVFSSLLTRGGKYWESSPNIKAWRGAVQSTPRCEDLKPLLKTFALKAKSPFRTKSEDWSEDNSETEGSAVPRKFRKVALHIWQDFRNGWQVWLSLLDAATSAARVASLVVILSGVFRSYVKHKSTEKVPETARMQTRQSSRRKAQVEPASSDSHDSVCLLCLEPGELMLCEGCSHVVHPLCIGLSEPPAEDWYCDGCVSDSGRVTRSRTKRLRLRTRT